MAEVFIGEAVSVQGFKKRVAIKRVLPHLAKNENFIQMFLDEARLSARLNHANIVSVFDISAHDDTYFLIMEFVDGANLKRITDFMQAQNRRFPLGEAAYICMEACRGLSYAHELADEGGQPLHIVHRDISPPNILVTKRGEIKVADFGLAKAGTQLSQTDPGVVKGKFSYLSPEAATGEEVDARADIFSLGIVLWEMLAGRRLFLGDTDYATVKLIQKANVPRLAPLNREVDEAFEEVLFRALARDPSHRFQSARDFGDALAGYLFNRQLKVTPYDIARLVTSATTEVPVAAPPPQENSLIDRLIQEQLDESIAIESGPGDSVPAAGLAGEMENPADWFNEDDLATTAAAVSKRGEERRSDRPEDTGSWRESGIDLEVIEAARKSEDVTANSPQAKAPPAPPANAAQASEVHAGGMAAPASANAAKATGSGAGKLILAAAVLVAVVAGALVVLGGRM